MKLFILVNINLMTRDVYKTKHFFGKFVSNAKL
jgi:hypothetical protein